MPSEIGDDADMDNDNDSDLEAELAAITAGSGGSRARPKPKQKQQIPAADLDRMVADSMKDIDDDDSDIDENDPDLLDELSAITEPNATEKPSPPDDTFIPTTSSLNTTDVLQNRIEMYKMAESNAKAANDSGRARRFGRGLKTLEDLLKQAKAGKTINMDDVPPEVTAKVAPAEPVAAPPVAPTRSAPAPPPKPVAAAVVAPKIDEQIIATLLARQRDYKLAALAAKKSGDTEAALNFVKIAKMFDAVVQAAQAGQTVDLSDMPPPPNEMQAAGGGGGRIQSAGPSSIVEQPVKEESESQNRTEDPASRDAEPLAEPEPLLTASTVLEALVQRLDKYKSVEQAAKDEDNTSKARR